MKDVKEFAIGVATITMGVLVGMVIYSQVDKHLLSGKKSAPKA